MPSILPSPDHVPFSDAKRTEVGERGGEHGAPATIDSEARVKGFGSTTTIVPSSSDLYASASKPRQS
ncbi:hypothetical protein Dimus_037791, partial [Dionaea muscipula]